MNFRIEIEPPTVTAQEKGLQIVRGKPYFYEKPEVKKAKRQFLWYLAQNRPEEPMQGALMLKTVWTFKVRGKHKPGEYRITRPDTDNLVKLFKDCMTKVGFFQDDSQVAYEITIKQWGETGSIDVMLSQMKEAEY